MTVTTTDDIEINLKLTSHHYSNREYLFQHNHNDGNSQDINIEDESEDLNINNNQRQEEEEKNQEININKVEEEGIETQPRTFEFNAEQHGANDNNDVAVMNNIKMKNVAEKDLQNTIISVHNEIMDDEDDTSKIERAVGLIEINHGQNDKNIVGKDNNFDEDENKDIIENEAHEYKLPTKPEIKQKAPTNLKLKRSFRAKTSRNRLQFSLLAGSPKQDDNNDSDINVTSSKSNLGLNVNINNDKLKTQAIDIKDNIKPVIKNNNNDDEESSDEFDF